MSKERLVHPTYLRSVIQKHGFSFKKQLGQNFLIDANILWKIIDAADVTEQDGVLEVGPGVGTLTQELAEHAGQVVAVEKDNRLIPILFDTLQSYSNVHIEHGDVLEVDLLRMFQTWFKNRRVSVVANLPYYITTPIVMKLLEERLPLHSIVVMVQKEVAERMAAKPGGKDYGVLSIAVQYYTKPSIVCKVPPGAFMPPPGVESTVIKLQVQSTPNVQVLDETLFFQVVKASFAQRRKTLLNNLLHASFLSKTKAQVIDILAAAHIDPQQRGETLSIQELANLTNVIFNNQGQQD